MDIWTINFDGAAFPNPGKRGGWGFILKKNGSIISQSAGDFEADIVTNNCAEYEALYHGIKEFLNKHDGEYCSLQVFGDSALVINQMDKKWRIKNGPYTPYANKTKSLLKQIEKNVIMEFFWIPREHNTECDNLSKAYRK